MKKNIENGHAQLSQYVRCINNKRFLFFKDEPQRDEAMVSLIVGHVYKLAAPHENDGDELRVIDESGEDYLYPASYFEPLIRDNNGHAAKTVTAHVPTWLYGVLQAEAVAADQSISSLLREYIEDRFDLPT